MNIANVNIVQRASELAEIAHSGQFRRDGTTPYINHPRAVALRVSGDPAAECVAWLHDVLEDTAINDDRMREFGIPSDVINCVKLLTKGKKSDYTDYLAAIKNNPIAKKVKIADMLSNLADQPTEKQIKKYCNGLLYLLE